MKHCHVRHQKTFGAIHKALVKMCSAQKQNAGRRVNLLAGLICGIIRSKSCQLP